ncbi:hypothetical protein PVAND_004663 [Polypedilum vanderplanki]|uniref:Peptidase S1 domain-containing protein n=1 Tax=Polypedilum vanderplanki TaxID=319348 RepID=A0A9J6BXW0_POLVA|nr:hypothetical protein PVAND_004663 [Polypedilum vanderplanki]
MKVLTNLIILILLIYAVSCISESEDKNNDSIIIEAAETNELKSRQKRQFFFTYPSTSFSTIQARWGLTGLNEACLTSRGLLGSCQTFKTCYPFFKAPEPITKFPNLNGNDYWILGNYDTCTYYSEDGRQAFGVCCTNPITEIPESSSDEQKIDLPNRQPSTQNFPPFGTFGSWPPPIPTHPPDHTPATHPPSFGIFNPVATQSPLKPASTTWATKPQNEMTTTTKKPSFIITTPESVEIGSNEVYGDSNCGIKNGNEDQNRIVGGQNADPQEWPWIAVLFNGGRQFCGGSLLDDIHILSAAHCVAHFSSWDVARLTVRLGDYNIRINTEVKHIERKVKRVVRHKGFDSRTLFNDIAILTLDQKVPFSRGIRPVCLPSPSSGLFNGQIGTVVGWGSLREMGAQPSILQEVSLPIWRNEECRAKYGPAAPGGIISSMICAGQAAKDSCSGGKYTA